MRKGTKRTADATDAEPRPGHSSWRRELRRRAVLWLRAEGYRGPILVAVFVFGLACAAVWRVFFIDLPPLPAKEALWSTGREPGIAFYDRNNRLIAVRGADHGRAARLAAMPPVLPKAFIAAEDRRFYSHDGVDKRAIMRAIFVNLGAGRAVQGGSTITQQLVKNLILTPEKSLRRKLYEYRLALELEQSLTKDEILELYLNRIYLGDRCYGVVAAAQNYFGKDLKDLSLGEAALLAALPKAPSLFASERDLSAARERQKLVLDRMVEAGFITPAEAEAAHAAPIRLVRRRALPEGGAAYALDFAQSQIKRLAPKAPPDLVVRLTIDPAVQAAADAAVADSLSRSGRALHVAQAAFLAVAHDGAVAAMVGGRDYNASKFNRVTQALRQPGSTFKPFVYAAALESGLNPNTIRLDAPVQVGKWAPHNYHEGFAGPVTLTYALSQSLNTVVVRLAREVGLKAVIEVAHRLGIRSPIAENYSIVLGASEVTLWELVAAYSPFAHDGFRVEPYVIAEIRDSRGTLIYRQPANAVGQAVDSELAHQMTFMLKHAADAGTAVAARLADRDIAGKTGTSQDWRDAWFVGYSADFIGGAWVGNDDRSPMRRVTGGTLPAEIWRRTMMRAHEGLPPIPLAVDDGVRLTAYSSPRAALYGEIAGAFRPRAVNEANAPPAARLDGIY